MIGFPDKVGRKQFSEEAQLLATKRSNKKHFEKKIYLRLLRYYHQLWL